MGASADATAPDAGLAPCPGCGALVLAVDGPTHAYLGASPGCWQRFGEVIAREFNDPSFFRVHGLTVHAYAVQHPGRAERRTAQSVTVHLLALFLLLERGRPQPYVEQRMQALAGRRSFPWLEPPAPPYARTVLDVIDATGPDAHAVAVRDWAASAWQAWGAHHGAIAALADASEQS